MWEGNRCGVGEEEKVVLEEGGLGDSLLGTRKDGKHSLDRREDVWKSGRDIPLCRTLFYLGFCVCGLVFLFVPDKIYLLLLWCVINAKSQSTPPDDWLRALFFTCWGDPGRPTCTMHYTTADASRVLIVDFTF